MTQFPGFPLAIADDQKTGMTFGELRMFVQNGMRLDIPDACRSVRDLRLAPEHPIDHDQDQRQGRVGSK
jgi:hypothetical protein